jgi:sodium/hydrogen exchanger family protein
LGKMATPVELILICLVAVALLALVARKIGVPYPILLTIAGGLLAFVPGLPKIRLDPKLVFDLFLPPLIYPAAVYTSWRDFRANLRSIQSVFLPGEKNAYLGGEPADDARFVAVFAHSLEHAGGYPPEEARRVAGKLLPDLLRYDPTRPASFPAMAGH